VALKFDYGIFNLERRPKMSSVNRASSSRVNQMENMFRTQKTREAISVLLESLGGTSTYGFITKLLVIADRESIKDAGRSITGDQVFALPQGPILSRVLDGLKGSHHEFDDFIERGNGVEIKLTRSVPASELTFSDLRILRKVASMYGSLTWAELKKLTHTFPEWKKFKDGQETWARISAEDIADGLGFSSEKRSALIEHMTESDEIQVFMRNLGDSSVATI
jgi:uncharacterized phage-associated protein